MEQMFVVMFLLIQGGGSAQVAVYRDMDACLQDAAKAQQTGTPDTRSVKAEVACIDISQGVFVGPRK